MGLSINLRTSENTSLLALSTDLSILYHSAEKLSSGSRINRASDDPAGLVISEQLRSRIGALGKEIENITQSISRYETVSSQVDGLRSQLSQLRELAVGAANTGRNSASVQDAYNASAIDLVSSFNAQVTGAEYDGQKTLDGSEGSLASISELSGIDLSSPEAAQASIATIDDAVSRLDSVQIDLGSTQRYDLESRRSSLEIARQNLTAAESLVRDTDYAAEFSDFVGSMIRTQAAIAMASHKALTGQSVLSLLNL